jgi:Phage integrase, N-terminal SAM-like domain
VRVQRVLLADRDDVSWTVLVPDQEPLAPVEAWLTHLSNVRRSPNTQKAYATDLRDYFVFLEQRHADWRRPDLELIGEWTAWLRRPTNACRDRDRPGLAAAVQLGHRVAQAVTTKDFLPQHQQQRSDTARLIGTAEGNGQFRMVQTNTTVLHKLDRIISTLGSSARCKTMARTWPVEAGHQPQETIADAG